MDWGEQQVMSAEEVMKLIKGFVDMLILASGYQSSGLLAHWDSSNITNAFHWAVFFENVFRKLESTAPFQDLATEIDEALSKVTSDPIFPQGLKLLSSSTLTRARAFLAEHMIHALTLRNEHLRALLVGTIEMDLDRLQGKEYDRLNIYLDELIQLSSAFDLGPDAVKCSMALPSQSARDLERENCISDNFTKLILQELLKRRTAVSDLLLAEIGLDVLNETISSSYMIDDGCGSYNEDLKNGIAKLSEEQPVDFVVWELWRSRNLSYFLDKRTIQLVSGASMIFSAPKAQWIRVFEQLNQTSEINGLDLIETLEVMLLGAVSSQWDDKIRQFMAISYDLFSISKQYQELWSLLQRRSQRFDCETGTKNAKEYEIIQYLSEVLGSQPNQLWKLSPVLLAAAIPSWSPLFRLYLTEIETQLRGDSSSIRQCSCVKYRKEHMDCALAERIWCLYAFHVCGARHNVPYMNL